MMRIIAGEYRGRSIEAPEGLGTRPTTDRVRESLMSSVASAAGGFEGLRVLDAFAGSGALGIEALSRGAAHATFTDSDAKAVNVIKKNVAKLGVAPARYRVLRADVLARAVTYGGPFDLVFLDPPYAYPATAILELLEALDSAGMLAPEALITYEHAKACDISPLFAAQTLHLTELTTKLYGDIAITFLGTERSDA